MRALADKYDLIKNLQREVSSMQGFKRSVMANPSKTGLGLIESAFAGNKFPAAAVHEFISPGNEESAATNGFICGLASTIIPIGGKCLWISTRRTVFPPALKLYNISPEQMIFLDLTSQKEALWTIEEALKCNALAVVIGEIKELSFTESRRLQLAVEKSEVTAFIHRKQPRSENTVACVSRWKIKPVASELEHQMPGLGFPRWDVELLKVRNGKPGKWQMEWSAQGFKHITEETAISLPVPKIKTG